MSVTPSPIPSESSPVPDSSRTHIARKGLPIVIATLISRPLGFIREAVQAALFGAARLTDIFIIAYNVPELIQTLFFSGVLSNFFVPIVTRYRDRREELSTVFSVTMNGALVLAFALAGGCYLLAPWVITLAAPGFTGADHDLAVFLFRFMLPMLVLHCLLSVSKGTLNSVDHYAMPEYAGVCFNIVMIVCALTLARSYSITSLAIGVVAGSVVQLLVQMPVLRQKGIRYHPWCGFRHPALQEMRGLILGALIATAVVPINAFIARAMASSLPAGSVSALAYAFRIFILPVSVFAVPVYTVLLTELSTAQQQGKQQRFKEQASAGLSLLFAVTLPATAVLIALSTQIVRILYERGQFGAPETLLTSQALIAYAVGIVGYGTSQIMVRLFNAMKDTATPAWVGIGSMGLSVIGNWFFMQWWGHWGIALVTSLVSYVNTLLLYAIFRYRHGPLDERALLHRFSSHLLLSAVVGLVLFGLIRTVPSSPGPSTSLLQFFYLAGVFSVGGALYIGLAFLFHIEEVLVLSRKVTQRLKRKR